MKVGEETKVAVHVICIKKFFGGKLTSFGLGWFDWVVAGSRLLESTAGNRCF